MTGSTAHLAHDASLGAPPDVLACLERDLGYVFADRGRLVHALAHRSYCAEHPGTPSNERLELLGDAVLDLVVTDHVYRTYPELPEGDLAKLRASVVSSEALAEVAAELAIGAALLLGKGEEATGGRAKASILADAVEAVIAAVYLDRGMTAAGVVVMSMVEERIAANAAGPGGRDYKTRLQELVSRRFDAVPRYRLRHDGPDHDRRFFASVMVRGEVWGEGQGRAKKQAEQAAARRAWERLAAAPPAGEGDDGDEHGGDDHAHGVQDDRHVTAADEGRRVDA